MSEHGEQITSAAAPTLEEQAVCIYEGVKYSVGSVSCQNGREFVCQNDGTWSPNGAEC
jgi:hypothetical protein